MGRKPGVIIIMTLTHLNHRRRVGELCIDMIDAVPWKTTLSYQRAVLQIYMWLTLVGKSRISCKQGEVSKLNVLLRRK